jgi:tetratricopeptide (TPR) repeat protein
LALAGFHALLIEGNAKKAQSVFDSGLQKDPADPYSLYGEFLLAYRIAHPERALGAALALTEAAPRHPLSTTAARYVFDLAGTSAPIDDAILAGVEKALRAGARGDAAHLLRSAAAGIQMHRRNTASAAEMLAALGVADQLTLIGPFSAYHVLGFDEPIAPEQTGAIEPKLVGPFGELRPRILRLPEGRVSLAGEGPQGDIYVLAVDVEAPADAAHIVRTVTSVPHKVYLDGELLYARRSFERFEPTVSAAGVELARGRHRVVVKLAKEDRTASFSLSMMRQDGQPSQLHFAPAEGPAPRWSGAAKTDVALVYPSTQNFADALRPECGEFLADFIAVRDGMVRDRDGAKRLVSELSAASKAPAIGALAADVLMGDRTVSSRIARGRATRELETTTAKDPGEVSALFSRASLAVEDGRLGEASELVKRARAAYASTGYPVLMLQARMELSLGLDGQADQTALSALAAQPGLCEALSLRYDVARRRDDVSSMDKLLSELKTCPGAQARAAEHAKSRGDLATAAAIYEELVARDPGQISNSTALSNLYLAQRRFEEAAKLLETLSAMWPRNAFLPKRLADVYEFWGKAEEAQRQREKSLAIDGSDLSLRRIVERRRTGKEVLAELAIDGKSAIDAYEAQHGTEDAAGAFVLDAAAVRAFPDGSTVDRIHIVQKALEQSGLSELAEVSIPTGAQVLAVRTWKPDGTYLEPENIEGKDSISMPGVQVGDYVEYEFLQAHPARGPAQPGFTSASFYYRVARMPNNWSTYTVLAPRGMGMAVDAHNMSAPSPQVKGEDEVFFHEERHVSPFIPEPDSAPSGNEYLPFVSLGAGAKGNDGLLASYGDAFIDRAQQNCEVERFARAATQGKKGREAVQALYTAVMERLSGRDAGLVQSASSSIAQDRGSRLWALKAGLEAIGIPARIAAVRTFGVDPTPYRFPNESLIPYHCVRAELPDGSELWLDTLIRFAPFGELPEQAAGRDAWLLPEPGRPLRKLKTPPRRVSGGKEIQLNLKLDPDGKLSGAGRETYLGFEAAQLAEAFEALTEQQRDQALEGALSRYFGGAQLSELKLDLKRGVGVPLVVQYSFTAPGFARTEGRQLVLGPLTFPAHLGRRFVQVGSRKTPLYIDSSEQNHTFTTVQLPPGYSLSEPLGEVKTSGKYGSFIRKERQDQNRIVIEETFRLDLARIPVDQYDDFTRFAAEVDLIQSRDLAVVKK